MAQNVTVQGASYSDVPALLLPKVGGGSARFDDTSDADATASDILSGKTAYVNGVKLTGTIASKSSTDLTASGATVTAPAGYYASSASKSVASGTAGTPTATKGTVSNHSVSVTPSVTNTTGYITGSTKTGTAVSVSASELVSGNKSITANGTNIDVANYSTVSVSVSGGFKKVSGTRLSDGTQASFQVESAPTEFYMYVTAPTSSGVVANASPYPIFEVRYDGTTTKGYTYKVSSRNSIQATEISGGTTALYNVYWSYSSGYLYIKTSNSNNYQFKNGSYVLYYK